MRYQWGPLGQARSGPRDGGLDTVRQPRRGDIYKLLCARCLTVGDRLA